MGVRTIPIEMNGVQIGVKAGVRVRVRVRAGARVRVRVKAGARVSAMVNVRV